MRYRARPNNKTTLYYKRPIRANQGTTMAKMNAQQVKIILEALEALETSHNRKAATKGVDAEIKSIYERKAAEVAATYAEIRTKGLDLQ